MAIVIMVAVIIEATTANATLNMPVLHTANPAATMENLMANLATTTANPRLEKIIPPMVIPRSFPR
jgi:hypothetical protein